MSSDNTPIAMSVGLILLLGIGWLFYESTACRARWIKSGHRYEWGVFSGCMVEVASNRWLPEEQLRDMDTLKR